MNKVYIYRTINFTEEEKDILVKAKEILRAIADELADESVTHYKNHQYISDILDICFEY